MPVNQEGRRALTEPLSPLLSSSSFSYLNRQTSSLVLQIHHSDRHSSDGTQDTSKRCSLSREQLAEHWGSGRGIHTRLALSIGIPQG